MLPEFLSDLCETSAISAVKLFLTAEPARRFHRDIAGNKREEGGHQNFPQPTARSV